MKGTLIIFILGVACVSTASAFSPPIPEVNNATKIAEVLSKGCSAIRNEADKASCAIAGLMFIGQRPSFSNENYERTSARGIDAACWSVSTTDSAAECYYAGAIHDHFKVWMKCGEYPSKHERAICFHASLKN